MNSHLTTSYPPRSPEISDYIHYPTLCVGEAGMVIHVSCKSEFGSIHLVRALPNRAAAGILRLDIQRQPLLFTSPFFIFFANPSIKFRMSEKVFFPRSFLGTCVDFDQKSAPLRVARCIWKFWAVVAPLTLGIGLLCYFWFQFPHFFSTFFSKMLLQVWGAPNSLREKIVKAREARRKKEKSGVWNLEFLESKDVHLNCRVAIRSELQESQNVFVTITT